MDCNRRAELHRIAQAIGGEYVEPDLTSSVGHVRLEKFKILLKNPLNEGGIRNEQFLLDKLRSFLPCTMHFHSTDGAITAHEVVQCYNVSRDYKQRKKADILLETITDIIPLSIKKDNADRWESAEGYFGRSMRLILDKVLADGTVCSYREGNFIKIHPEFVVPALPNEIIDVSFGSDILHHGAILVRSFADRDFQWINGALRVECSHVLTEPMQITGSLTPWFFLHNTNNRNCRALGLAGPRIEARYESRIGKYTIRLPDEFLSIRSDS